MKTLKFKDNEFFLVISDLHLEKKSTIYQEFIIDQINTAIDEHQQKNEIVYVLCAGDLNNETHGFKFLSKINTKVFYVAGNHEYWGTDFSVSQQNLKNHKISNVQFLNNDIATTSNSIILGTTLWSDLATNLNPSLFNYLNHKMTDQFQITVNSHQWTLENVLDQNKKAWFFINSTCNIIQYLRNLYSLFYSNKKHSKTLLNNFWNDLSNLSSSEFLTQYQNYIHFIYDKSQPLIIDSIFEKIKMDFLKPLIVLTHHLPFYEEPLVYFYQNKKQDLLEDFLNIYNVKTGFTYKQNNHFHNIKETNEVNIGRQLVKLGHYVNNGSHLAHSSVYNTVCAWVHGHEHTLNHQNYVKGIFTTANPTVKNSLLLDLSEYPEHIKIKTRLLTKDNKLTVHEIQNNLFNEFSHENFLKPSALDDYCLYQSFKNHDWNLQLNTLFKIKKSTEILSQNKQVISDLPSKSLDTLELILDSLQYNKSLLDNLMRKLFINYILQYSCDFNITKHEHINSQEYSFIYSLGTGQELQKPIIPSYYLYDTTPQNCFLLLEKTKQSITFTKKIQSIFSSNKLDNEKLEKLLSLFKTNKLLKEKQTENITKKFNKKFPQLN